jgi:hypothetical protein
MQARISAAFRAESLSTTVSLRLVRAAYPTQPVRGAYMTRTVGYAPRTVEALTGNAALIPAYAL